MEYRECEICGEYENTTYMVTVVVFGDPLWVCLDCDEDW